MTDRNEDNSVRIKTTFELNDLIIKEVNKTLMIKIGSHVACIESIEEIDKMLLSIVHFRNKLAEKSL